MPFSDLLDRSVDPTCGGFGIEENLLTQWWVDLLADRTDDFGRDVVFAIRLQCLHKQTAFGQPETSLLESGVLECEGRSPNLVGSVGAIGQIQSVCRHLR